MYKLNSTFELVGITEFSMVFCNFFVSPKIVLKKKKGSKTEKSWKSLIFVCYCVG
jgi:hypothetical protein